MSLVRKNNFWLACVPELDNATAVTNIQNTFNAVTHPNAFVEVSDSALTPAPTTSSIDLKKPVDIKINVASSGAPDDEKTLRLPVWNASELNAPLKYSWAKSGNNILVRIEDSTSPPEPKQTCLCVMTPDTWSSTYHISRMVMNKTAYFLK